MRSVQPAKPDTAEARQLGFFTIGEAATASGVSAKMIRHYEQIKLITPAHRSYSNYRIYSTDEVYTLAFIKRARLLGFTTRQIATLLSLWQNQSRSSAEVKKLAMAHADELEMKIREMQTMRDELLALANSCQGDDRPGCPILEGLAQPHDGRNSTN